MPYESSLAARNQTILTIASGASVSDAIDTRDTALLGFLTPAAWTTAALNIEASADGTTWLTVGLYDSTGSATGSYAAPAVAAGYAVDPISFLPYRYVRFRSGTLAAPTNQAAARVFTVITRPLA